MNVKKGQDVFKDVRIGVNLVLSNNHPLGSLVTFHILGCFFVFFLQYDELKKHPVIRSPVDQNDSLFREVIDLCHQKAY